MHYEKLGLAAWFLASIAWPAAAQTTVHRLVVAANPVLNLANEDVDAITRGMTRILRSKDYAWDESCADVKFIRDGDVILDTRIPGAGTYGDLAKAARSINPRINVVMALRLSLFWCRDGRLRSDWG